MRRPEDLWFVQQPPIIVRIVEPEDQTLRELLIGSLGLTAVILLIAILCGAVLAGVLFWVRRT
jgi:hypothetical protein